MSAISENYVGAERRSGDDRRMQIDKRNNVRFDKSGGDRRTGAGRRAGDEHLEVLE